MGSQREPGGCGRGRAGSEAGCEALAQAADPGELWRLRQAGGGEAVTRGLMLGLS